MIIRNKAQCTACGVEIESKGQHDFQVHYCEVDPEQRRRWVGDKLLEVPGETTWRFAVDGGRAYIRRVGTGFVDTSEFKDDAA